MNMVIITGILLNLSAVSGNYDSEIMSKIKKLNENVLLETIDDSFTKLTVDVTAYSPRVGETDSTPFTTASNKRVKESYIAISRDLEVHLGFGDKVFIKGLGIFEVQDRMNRRWRSRVDVFFFDTQQALRFGKIKREMWILESQKNKKRLARD